MVVCLHVGSASDRFRPRIYLYGQCSENSIYILKYEDSERSMFERRGHNPAADGRESHQ